MTAVGVPVVVSTGSPVAPALCRCCAAWARLGRRLPAGWCLRMADGGWLSAGRGPSEASERLGRQVNRSTGKPPKDVALGRAHQTRSTGTPYSVTLNKPAKRLETTPYRLETGDTGDTRHKWRRALPVRRRPYCRLLGSQFLPGSLSPTEPRIPRGFRFEEEPQRQRRSTLGNTTILSGLNYKYCVLCWAVRAD